MNRAGLAMLGSGFPFGARGDMGGEAPAPLSATLIEPLHGQALVPLLATSDPSGDRAERAILWRGLDPGKVG